MMTTVPQGTKTDMIAGKVADVLLHADRLTLRNGGTTLLADFNWQVRAGEFWCVLGKNGIGKSTLLHAVAGLLPPEGGCIRSPDGDIAVSTPQQLARWRGMVAQQQFDAFSCSVIDYVMAGLHPYRPGWGWPDEADRRTTLAALDRLGMASCADADVTQLSGGERQRIAIATLMLQAPQLYLLDEPASHQDVASQQMLLRLLRGLADDKHAVVASMHDINLAARFATHIILIGPQRWWSGAVDDVLQPELLQAAFGCRFNVISSEQGKWFSPF